MKKTTRSKSAKPASSAGIKRHSKSTKKPVTIDLKAEAVEPKSEAPVAEAKTVRQKPTSQTSVPKSAKKEKPKISESAVEKENSAVFGRKSEEQTTSPPQDTPKAVQTETSPKSARSSGFVPALVGGCVALLGAGVLQYAGILGTPGGGSENFASKGSVETVQSEISQKIGQLETRLDEQTPAKMAPEINALIDKKIEETGAVTAQTTSDEDIQLIASQVNETTVRVEKLQSDLSTLNDTLGTLQTAVSNGESGENAALSTITAKLEDVSRNIETVTADVELLKTNSSGQTGEQNQAGTEEQANALAAIAALQAALPGLQDKINSELTGVNDKLATLEKTTSGLADLSQTVETLKSGVEDNKASALAAQTTLEQLQNELSNSDEAEKRAAQALAAAALKSEIDSGRPFADTLSTLVGLTGANEELTQLAGFSETGIPTVAQLSKQFTSVGEDVIKALTVTPNDDLTSRLIAGAKAFVKVKTTEPIEGSGPDATISQISAFLTEGKLEEASTTWLALPEAGKAVSSQWHDRLKSRIQANSLVANTVQSFLNSSTKR